jgi:hypothetical protein
MILGIAFHVLLIKYRDLFPKPGPDSDQQKFDLEIDRTMGGRRPPTNDATPDANAFGFYIMSGMKLQKLSTFDALIIFQALRMNLHQ